MNESEVAHLRQWIGREERQSEQLTSALVERFEATLGTSAAVIDGHAPLAIHWCLTQPAIAAEGLGPDGHPARGGFLPPVPLPRRMWAGGELSFIAPLRTGELVTRISRIADVTHKLGRSGELVFVTIEHDILSGDTVALKERQNIVYRAMDKLAGQPAPSEPAVDATAADRSEMVEATTTLLFRYSALTFNGHRIHYDLDYAREREGYQGLVVHGPLQATLLLHMAARMNGNQPPTHFAYRGVAPLVHGGTFSLNAAGTADRIELWTAGRDGARRMTANVSFA